MAPGTQQYHTAKQIQLGVEGAAFKDNLFNVWILLLTMKIIYVTVSLVVQPPVGVGMNSIV